MTEKHSGQAPAEKHGRRYIDPDFRRRRRAEEQELQRRFEDLAGPVVTRRVEEQ